MSNCQCLSLVATLFCIVCQNQQSLKTARTLSGHSSWAQESLGNDCFIMLESQNRICYVYQGTIDRPVMLCHDVKHWRWQWRCWQNTVFRLCLLFVCYLCLLIFGWRSSSRYSQSVVSWFKIVIFQTRTGLSKAWWSWFNWQTVYALA